MKKLFFTIFAIFIFTCTNANAEQCTDCVHALLPWTNVIRGNAKDWPQRAKSLKFKVDHCPQKDTVLVYPPDYGSGIDKEYGHVAILRSNKKDGKYMIQDSNGMAGKDRGTAWRSINFKKVKVIHNKK